MCLRQRAINLEAVSLALKKSSQTVYESYKAFEMSFGKDFCLSEHLKACSSAIGVTEQKLSDCYDIVKASFDKLPQSVKIIDNTVSHWPENLTDIPFLYAMGDTGLLKERGISIVGTRSPSVTGLTNTRNCVKALDGEFVIISGLAMGIDGAAHIQALADGRKTIAVIGTPIDKVYPKEHEKLQLIIAEKGLVVSQFAPYLEVQKYFFMQRNMTMSRISKASLVIESNDGGGGVRQAEYSAKQGKPVFVLKDTYENRTFLWPRTTQGVVVISGPEEISKLMREPKKQKQEQPEFCF